jgi:hypothetical protein
MFILILRQNDEPVFQQQRVGLVDILNVLEKLNVDAVGAGIVRQNAEGNAS